MQVAAGRILHALNADAKVTVVCPSSGLNDEVSFRVSEGQVSHVDRTFEPQDLDGADMVLCAIDDPVASSRVWQLCKERRIPANIADVPPECDFYFGSIHRDGPLQIMVSTNGNGPKMANIVRRKIADALPDNTGTAIENVGRLRKKLREIAPDSGQGPKRMKWYVSWLSLLKTADIVGYLVFVTPGAWGSSSRWMITTWTVCLPIMNPARFPPFPIFEVIERSSVR